MATQDERAARRQGVERDLRRYEERSRYLDKRLEAAMSALQKAQEDLALATTRAQNARIDCDTIRRHLAFDPDTINGLPCEMLQAIFLHFSGRTDGKGIENMSYTYGRSQLPYRLGAVCRHWRRVVHDTPELWAHIATPPWSSRHHKFFAEYVERHLFMSRSRPLHLCLAHICQNNKAGADAQWFAEIVATLSMHARRWRTLKLVYPQEAQARIFESLSANPPLLLEDVFLGRAPPVTEAQHNTPVDASWLSGAPHLRQLYTERIALRLTSALPRLQSANLWVNGAVGLDALANTLLQLPCLQDLSLFFVGVPSTVLSPVDLPALQSLTVRGRDTVVERMVTRLVTAPQLRKLTASLPSYDWDGSWGQRYVAAFPDITELKVVSDDSVLGATHAVTFGRLSRVRHLVFERCAFPRRVATDGAARSFWLSATSSMWPELESLELSSYPSAQYLDSVLSEIGNFVSMHCAASNGLGKRFSLSLTRWPTTGLFPRDFVRELVRALGADNVRLETQSGGVQSVSAADEV